MTETMRPKPNSYNWSNDKKWWIQRANTNVWVCPCCGESTRHMAGAHGSAFIFHAADCPRFPGLVQGEQIARRETEAKIEQALAGLAEFGGIFSSGDRLVMKPEVALDIVAELKRLRALVGEDDRG